MDAHYLVINDEFAQINVLSYNHHAETNFNKFSGNVSPEEDTESTSIVLSQSRSLSNEGSWLESISKNSKQSVQMHRWYLHFVHIVLSYMLRGSYNSIHFIVRYTVVIK